MDFIILVSQNKYRYTLIIINSCFKCNWIKNSYKIKKQNQYLKNILFLLKLKLVKK